MARNSGGGFGTWFYGFLVGGVIGVSCCAAAALYITKAPIPFVNKVNQASEKSILSPAALFLIRINRFLPAAAPL